MVESYSLLIEPPLRVMRWALVEEAVEDGVSEGAFADNIVPVLDGDLRGEDGPTAGIAVVEDFEQIVASLGWVGKAWSSALLRVV